MKKTLVLFLILSKLALCAPVDSLTVYSLSARDNIDFTASGTNQKVASYLVINSNTASPITTILSFANGCNVTHFRRTNLTIPITSVLVKVNNVTVTTATTADPPCSGVFSWSPAGPAPYEEKYQIDIFISWNGEPMNIAGTYAESLNFWAYK